MTPTKVTVLEINQDVGWFSRIDITTSFLGKGHGILISPCSWMTRIDGIIQIVAAEIGTRASVALVARIILDTINTGGYCIPGKSTARIALSCPFGTQYRPKLTTRVETT